MTEPQPAPSVLGPTVGDRPPRLTWVGHSTVRIELDGVVLLTDPLLRMRVTHLRRLANLAPQAHAGIDAVLISHAHYDHLDVPSLRAIGKQVTMVVPRGVGKFLTRRGFHKVVELDEGETADINGVVVRAVFAEHSSLRVATIAGTPALGYIAEGSQRIYFAGDTDLFPGMAHLAGDLDVALMPIAGWGKSTGPGHLGPREAAEALAILQPRVGIPIHWGTYAPMTTRRPSPSSMLRPAEDFGRHVADLAPGVDTRRLEVGESIEIDPRVP